MGQIDSQERFINVCGLRKITFSSSIVVWKSSPLYLLLYVNLPNLFCFTKLSKTTKPMLCLVFSYCLPGFQRPTINFMMMWNLNDWDREMRRPMGRLYGTQNFASL